MPSGRFPAAFFCPRAGLLSPWREGTAPTPREAEGAAQRRRDEAWVENMCAWGGRGGPKARGSCFPGRGEGLPPCRSRKGRAAPQSFGKTRVLPRRPKKQNLGRPAAAGFEGGPWSALPRIGSKPQAAHALRFWEGSHEMRGRRYRRKPRTSPFLRPLTRGRRHSEAAPGRR